MDRFTMHLKGQEGIVESGLQNRFQDEARPTIVTEIALEEDLGPRALLRGRMQQGKAAKVVGFRGFSESHAVANDPATEVVLKDWSAPQYSMFFRSSRNRLRGGL